MNVGAHFVLASTMLYLGAAIAFAYSRQWQMSLVYVGYTLANLGVLHLAYNT